MSSRWKKVWADFWGNKTRTLLTILTIMVGAFAVGFNSSLSAYMAESMETDYLSSNPSEAQVYAHPMTDDNVKAARSVPGVSSVEGRNTLSAKLLRPDGKKYSIQFTALEDPSKLTVNLLKPAVGQLAIPPLGKEQVLIDSSADGLGYRSGDVLTIELDSGKTRELHLAGTLHDATGIPFKLTEIVNAFVTPDTMVWLGGSRDYNALVVSVAERPTDSDHVTAVAQSVADRMGRSGANVDYVYVYQPGHHYAYSIAQGMFYVMGVLGWLTVLLSAFLIVNTITALMAQQTRQIGIMKATGGSTLQILFMYVVLILGFGVTAWLISAPLGSVAARAASDAMANWLNFFPAPFHSFPAALTQQAIVAIAVPLLAALGPLFNSARITVREALSDYGLGGNARPKDRGVPKGRVLIPRPIQLSLRNTFRRKTRLALTLFTLVLAGAIFISVLNLRDSFAKVLHDVEGYFLADINMSFDRAYRIDRVSEIARRVPGVEDVEGWLQYPGTLVTDKDATGRQIVFVAPPSTSKLIKPIMTSGRWLQPGDENAIVIGNHLQTMFPSLKVGDWLTIKVNGKDTRWHIVGTYIIAGNSDVPLLYVNYEYISRLIDQPGEVYSLRVITTSHDALMEKRVNDTLMALFASRGIKVTDSRLSADFIKNQTSQFDIFVIFLLSMAILIALVGGLGLMGTMSINVMERTREIGVMRSIGASNGNIQSIVIVEGMLIGLISWLISLALSVPMTIALCTGVGVAILTSPMPPVYGLTGMLAWLIGILVIGTLASALPAHRASSLTVRDTLAYE